MKKICFALFVCFAMFILAGCGNDSPKEVAVKCAESMASGNLEKAVEYTTGDMRKEAEGALPKNWKEEINGEEAKVIAEPMGKRIVYRLKKVGGKWKIDGMQLGDTIL